MTTIIAVGIFSKEDKLRQVYWSEPSLAGAYLSRAVQEGKNNRDNRIIVSTVDNNYYRGEINEGFIRRVILDHEIPHYDNFIEIRL